MELGGTYGKKDRRTLDKRDHQLQFMEQSTDVDHLQNGLEADHQKGEKNRIKKFAGSKWQWTVRNGKKVRRSKERKMLWYRIVAMTIDIVKNGNLKLIISN